MANIDKRPLKAYVRFDGTGRIVPSSLILRRKMPKVGKWVEIPAYECCNDITPVLYYTPTLPIDYPDVRIFCDDLLIDNNAESGVYTTIADLVEGLNGNTGYTQYGTYSVGPNGSVKLTLSPAALALCTTGILSMTIIPD
jgi:hypothetical protein